VEDLLRCAAIAYLRRAHDVFHYSLDPDWQSSDATDEAADRLIAVLNRLCSFRSSLCPIVPDDESEDLDMRAWDAREEALRTMPYPDYLQTPEWAARRRTALRRAGDACQTCGGHGPLHLHHRTYERRGEELVDDLVVLCEDCHLAVHASGGSHRPRNLA